MTSSGSSKATGTVTFKDGATVLGTGALNTSGVAMYATSTLAVGAHSITAVYGGDSNNAGSTSAVLNETVNTAVTATTVAGSPNPSPAGSTVTLTATVRTNGSRTPTGTITFKDGSATLGSGTLNTSGVATYATSTLTAGTHSITAVYGGDSNNAGSTSSVVTETITVALPTTTTGLTASPDPVTAGSNVTFTAAVTTTGSKTPTGSVTFMDGSATLGTAALNSSAIATYSTSTLSVGQHSITAVYGADTNNAASTSTVLIQTVNAVAAATTTTVVSNANPSTSGSVVTFTATVATSGSKTPTGTVSFKDGSAALGTGTLNGSGLTTYAISSLSVGQHPITAVYGGDSYNTASTSAGLTQSVNAANTTTTALASSVNPSFSGGSVTFTATVTAPGVPSGTVTFGGSVTFSDGSTSLATVQSVPACFDQFAVPSCGVATYTTSTLAPGQHPMVASYAGNQYGTPGSTSAVLTQTVKSAATTTALASSANPSTSGSPVTFTATVATTGPIAPTGVITFQDGSTTLGTSALNGSAIATLATSSLAAGTHSIMAVYGGDTNNVGSTSAALMQTVQQPTLPTTTILASSANPSTSGSPVTFTATVTTTGPIAPTGVITFQDGSTTLGTGTLNGGVTTFTTTALALGQLSITAVYGGDANNAGSISAALTEMVNAADFVLTSSSTNATVTAGQSGTFTLTVTPQGSFTSPISFSCAGLPTLAGCGFSPASVTPNSSTVTTTLTITTSAHAAARAAVLTPAPVGHRPGPLYATWLVLPAILLGTARRSTTNRRKLLSYCLVFLLVGGCLLQVACGGGSMGGSGGGGGTGGTPAGTYTVNVTGAAGSAQQTMAVTLTVQ